MGDRWNLKLHCAFCGKLNPKQIKNPDYWEDNFIYYAPTCEVKDFKCDYCGKKNKIVEDFKAAK